MNKKDFEFGYDTGLKAAAIVLGRSQASWNVYAPAQYYHFFMQQGECGCSFDDEYGWTECEDFTVHKDKYFMQLYNMSREGYEEMIREIEAAQRQRQRQQEEELAAATRQHIEDRAREQGIDPKLLP